MTKEQQLRRKTQLTQAAHKRLYAPAFGLLAATVGILAGGPPVPMAGLGLLFAALYLQAEHQGWLLGSPAGTRRREYAVTAVFSLLVAIFVFLTGGASSPMPCALYLPVLLASLCYSLRLGLATSAVMVAVAAFLGTGGQVPLAAPSLRAIAIGLSFPVVAVFGGALRAQMESRLAALSSEKEDLSELLDMSQQMDAAFDLDMTLNLILLNVQEHSLCDVCAVYLKAADGRTLELRAVSAPPNAGPLLPALSVDEARGESLRYAVRMCGDTAVCGLNELPERWRAQIPAHWITYFTVDDAAASAAFAAAQGARVLMPVARVNGVGCFCVLNDPQGAAFGLFSPAPRTTT